MTGTQVTQDDADGWMIYGAYGYTGRLIVDQALVRGHRPVLAGRDPQRTLDLGRQTGLPVRIFGLEDPATVRRNVQGMRVVLHTAGPFSATALPMLEACIEERAHYLDITGEIDVFEAIHSRSDRLRLAGIAAIPGVGFDVVPTDALAALLKERLPDATTLKLAFVMRGGGLSPGTAKTMVESASGGRIRQGGEIIDVPTLHKVRQIPFPGGEQTAVTIGWGDVSTAFHTTGIPDIEVYLGVSRNQLKTMRSAARFQWLLTPKPVQAFLKARIGRRVLGPDAEARRNARTELWGEATAPSGATATLTMRTPEGYSLTAESAVRATELVLAGKVGAGAWTPSKAFGARFVLEIPGVELGSEASR